ARAGGFFLTGRNHRDAGPPCQRRVAGRPALDFQAKTGEPCRSRSDVGEMTTKPPTGLAASGRAEDPEVDQITKEHDEEADDITVDPSGDVTVEATEDVTIEAIAS